MGNFEDRMKKTFHNTDLSHEDWLVPDQSIYDGFEDQIKKKKKSRGLIYFLLGILGMIGLLWISLQQQNKAMDPELSKVEFQVPSSVNQAQDLINQISVDEKNPSQLSLLTDENDGSDLTEQQGPTQVKIKKNERRLVKKNKTLGNNLSQSIIELNEETKQGSMIQDLIKNQTVAFQNSSIIHTFSQKEFSDPSSSSGTSLNEIQFDRVEEVINFIGLKPINKLEHQRAKINFGFYPNVVSKEYIKKNVFYQLAFSYVNWNLQLNENYNNALSPADFYHSQAHGYLVDLNVGLPISNRLDFVVGLGFEKLKLYSGHNSTIRYDQDIEENQSNEIELAMASPMGFMNSNIVIRRNEATSEQDLVIDLKTQHQFTAVSLSSQLKLALIENNRWSYSQSVNGSFMYITNLTNSLDQATVLNDAYSTETKFISGDQQFINTFIPFVGTSAEINYKVNSSLSIGISASYEFGLRTLHQESDFSSSIRKGSVGLQLNHQF